MNEQVYNLDSILRMILRRIRNWLVVFLNKRRVPVPLLQNGVLLIFQDRSNRT